MKALKAQACNELDELLEAENQPLISLFLVRHLIILIDLLDTLIEPEEPD